MVDQITNRINSRQLTGEQKKTNSVHTLKFVAFIFKKNAVNTPATITDMNEINTILHLKSGRVMATLYGT